MPGEAADFDAHNARASLIAFALAILSNGKDAERFVVHRLVQDFARSAMSEERRAQALREALQWVDGAFVGDPQDVRTWPVLDPLAPHALAVARRGHETGIAEPTAGLLNRLGLLSSAKGFDRQAELLIRQAVNTYEASLGADHPRVAATLNNLAKIMTASCAQNDERGLRQSLG